MVHVRGWFKMRFKIVYVKDIPGGYVGMNYYAAKEKGIPFPRKKNLIWVKKGDKSLYKSTIKHEKVELELMMKKGMKYKQAHSIANYLEDESI
jgi:hypothetical protein